MRLKNKLSLRNAGLFACIMSLAGLGMIMLFSSHARATDLPVIHKSGTLSANETWVTGSVYYIDSTLTIPSGVTLTISEGAIVKNDHSYGLRVENGGHLNVEGASSSPVIFTSYADDSYGGDSNANGSSSGSNSDYSSQIQQAGGTVDVSFAVFAPHGLAIGTAASCSGTLGTTTVTDSNFNDSISMYRCTSGIDLQRNIFAVQHAGSSIQVSDYIDVTGIVLSGINKNVFAGNSVQRKVEIHGTVPTGTTWDVDNASNVVLAPYSIQVDGTMSVDEGIVLALTGGGTKVSVNGALNMVAGSIVKIGTYTTGFAINNGGELNILGSSSSNVIFTSDRDDSVGGDTNGDGSSAGSAGNYASAIAMKGGSVNATHAVFRYGGAAFNTPDSCSGSVGTLAVVDSTFAQPLSMYRCISSITLERNEFAVATLNDISLQIGDNIDATGIVLAGSNKNIFSGTPYQRQIEVAGTVPTNKEWTVEDASGAILKATYLLTVDGTLNLGPNITAILNGNWDAVRVNGAVNVGEGAIIKINGYSYSGNGFIVNSGGELTINGTTNSPVTFTSLKDDAVGGDLGGDGATTGAAGNYGKAIIVNNGGAASVQYANFSYGGSVLEVQGGELTVHDGLISHSGLGLWALGGQIDLEDFAISNVYTGLDVGGGAQVVYRGSITNVGDKAVQACNWDAACKVDATYTDWGANGPFPPSGNLVCGSVVVSPWKVGSTTSSASLFAVRNCNGSTPTPDEELSDSIEGFQSRISGHQTQCSGGLQDACDAYNQAFACLAGALSVAGSTSPFPLPDADTAAAVGTFGGSTLSLASDYVSSLADVSPGGFSLGLISGLASTLGTFTSLIDAYDSCG